jgi:hypothetical protein
MPNTINLAFSTMTKARTNTRSLRIVLSLAFLSVLVLTAAASADELVWKTESKRSEPKELPSCDMEKDANCGDHVPYVEESQYGANMYVTYYEGVRAGVGFGTVPHDATVFLAGQLHPGGLDWGGVEEKGEFVPQYVIKRFFQYDAAEDEVSNAVTFLLVFQILPNGKSCVVDVGSKTTAINVVARKWAEDNRQSPRCN